MWLNTSFIRYVVFYLCLIIKTRKACETRGHTDSSQGFIIIVKEDIYEQN